MPMSIILAISPEVQAPMWAALRRARYGYVLALQMGLWCAVGRHPTAIAAVLFCARQCLPHGAGVSRRDPGAGT